MVHITHANPLLRRSLSSYGFIASAVHEIHPREAISHHWFGSSVHLSDKTAIVGAPGDSDYNKYGAAYIYRKTSGHWKEIRKLTPSTPVVDDGFGSAVSIYDNYAIVGAYRDDANGEDSGSVYYFSGDENWAQIQKIVPSDGVSLDYFGSSVSQYRREELIVGAWGVDYGSYTSCGAAYFYRFGNSVWNLEEKMLPADIHSYQWFGISVAIYQSKAAVGAWGDNEGGSVSGAVYTYDHSMGNWHKIQKFSTGVAGNHMGYAVSMHEDVLAVGLPNSYRTTMGTTNNPNAYRTGMVKIFRLRDYNHWELEQNVVCSDCENLVSFGQSVSASSDKVVIGRHGAATVWTLDASQAVGYRWSQEVSLTSGDSAADDSYFFGSAVAIDGGNVLLGVKDSDMRTHSSGDAYIRVEEAGVAVLFESPRNNSSNRYFYKENLKLYVGLYIMIVLGIAVVLVAPLVIFGYHMYTEDKDTAKILEMKPFIKASAQRSDSYQGLKKNSIERSKP